MHSMFICKIDNWASAHPQFFFFFLLLFLNFGWALARCFTVLPCDQVILVKCVDFVISGSLKSWTPFKGI